MNDNDHRELIDAPKLREECGVFGVFGHQSAARFAYYGLFALQHRGQEACGIVSFENHAIISERKVSIQKSFGLVGEVFNEESLSKLRGECAVGHVRYSTHGGPKLENIQPFKFRTSLGEVAIAHNGNLTNSEELRVDLESKGTVFQSTSDSETFVHLIARSTKYSFVDRLMDSLPQVDGAYSLVVATHDTLIGARDPHGFRPLALGKLVEQGQTAYFLASESCAFDLIGASYVRELEPGEVLVINKDGLFSQMQTSLPDTKSTYCSFEPIYFSRPDSLLLGSNVYGFRKRIGEVLAEECPTEADLVMAIPDSGVAMAEGYAQKSSIPLRTGLIRNHYVGRTFIQPTQSDRDLGVRLKLNVLSSVVRGKRLVVVDDSLVRGTTSARIFEMLRSFGAKEIHFRVGAPPITHSCYYGVDTPKRKELMAASLSVDQIREQLKADSLGFISQKGLLKALENEKNQGFCLGCFSGKYPTKTSFDGKAMPTDAKGPGLFSKK